MSVFGRKLVVEWVRYFPRLKFITVIPVAEGHIPPKDGNFSQPTQVIRCTHCGTLSAYDDNSPMLPECTHCGQVNTKFQIPRHIYRFMWHTNSGNLGWVNIVSKELEDS